MSKTSDGKTGVPDEVASQKRGARSVEQITQEIENKLYIPLLRSGPPATDAHVRAHTELWAELLLSNPELFREVLAAISETSEKVRSDPSLLPVHQALERAMHVLETYYEGLGKIVESDIVSKDPVTAEPGWVIPLIDALRRTDLVVCLFCFSSSEVATEHGLGLSDAIPWTAWLEEPMAIASASMDAHPDWLAGTVAYVRRLIAEKANAPVSPGIGSVAEGVGAAENRVALRLRLLREEAGLSIEQLAAQVSADISQLEAAEAGGHAPSAPVLARCAMLAGLELDEFLRGNSLRVPSVALLRAAADVGSEALQTLQVDRVPLLCGELVHRARLVRLVEEACGLTRAKLPTLSWSTLHSHRHPAEVDAERARRELEVGDGPIPSMREVLERHGVLIVWTEEDEIPDAIAGISLLQPLPTVLANLRHGKESYWHTRMTLAHELGHLLFDHLRGGTLAMHSAAFRRGRAPFEDYEEIERAANAFAACFLAPSTLVRQCVGAYEPDSEDAVSAVGSQCGVGRTVAINRLQDVFGLSDESRTEMERRPSRRYDALGREDVPWAREIGLRRGMFRQRVVEALSRDMISRERAWSLLGLTPTEPLTEAPTAALRSPLVSLEQTVVERAQRTFTSSLHPHVTLGWSPVAATPEGNGRWRVQFVQGAGAPSEEKVFALIYENGRIVDPAGVHEGLISQLVGNRLAHW